MRQLEHTEVSSPGPKSPVRRIYVCHPFSMNPARNAERVRTVCRSLVESGQLPIAPQVYLPQFMDEATEREHALRLCLELVGACDALFVYGACITDGMLQEIEHAQAHGIPVQLVDAEVV